MSNLAKYGSYDLDAADAEEQANQQGADFMKLGVGRNIVRILPPPLGKKSPFRVVWTHFIDLPGGGRVNFVCPDREGKQPCPACQTADKLKASNNPADHERAKGFFARRRVYCAAVNRETPEAGVLILPFGVGVHDDLIALRKNPDWGGDFTHPETGFDVVIERKGTGKNDTEYKVSPRKQSPLGNPDWLNQLPDLDRLSKVLPYDTIMAKLRGEKSEGAGGGGGKPSAGKTGTVVDATFDEAGNADGTPF